MLRQHIEHGSVFMTPEQENDYERVCQLVRPFASLNGFVSDAEMSRFKVPKTIAQIEWEKKHKEEYEATLSSTRGHWINHIGTTQRREKWNRKGWS